MLTKYAKVHSYLRFLLKKESSSECNHHSWGTYGCDPVFMQSMRPAGKDTCPPSKEAVVQGGEIL